MVLSTTLHSRNAVRIDVDGNLLSNLKQRAGFINDSTGDRF